MPSDKQRLHIALYARGGATKARGREDTYHWALIVGPKSDEHVKLGFHFHAKESVVGPDKTQWIFEESDLSLGAVRGMLLVRMTIAKVENLDRLREVFRSVPIKQGTEGWNCIAWVQSALTMLAEDEKALGTHVIEWPKVRDAAAAYCSAKKAAHRFDGTGSGDFDIEKPPTFDLMTNKEVTP